MTEKEIEEAMRSSRGLNLKQPLRRHRGKARLYSSITIRGEKYVHYSMSTKRPLAVADRDKLQKKGFKVLLRQYGPRKFHVWKGPKKKRK